MLHFDSVLIYSRNAIAELVYGKTPDNYLLFAVEQQIASQAIKQCRSFVDPKSNQGNIHTLIEKNEVILT